MTANPIPLRPVQKPQEGPWAVLAGGLFTAFPTESAALSAARIAAQKDPGSLIMVDAPSGAIPESAPPRDVDAWFREASSDEIETLIANRQLEQQP